MRMLSPLILMILIEGGMLSGHKVKHAIRFANDLKVVKGWTIVSNLVVTK